MTVHVVGAGLAGLAAASHLARGGARVVLHEATGAAGGRCRSLRDPKLGLALDTGIHLMLGDQASLHALLADAGAPPPERIPLDACGFLDCADGATWQLRPGTGRLPFWLLDPARRVPGTGLRDLAQAARLLWAPPEATLGAIVPAGTPGRRRFWEPFCVAVLNTRPEEADAGLLARFLRAVMLEGSQGRDPLVARGGLQDGIVAPLLARLAALGVAMRWRHPLRGLEVAGDRVAALRFARDRVVLGPDDAVVLALPPRPTARLVPGVARMPDSPIVTVHFRLPQPLPRRFTTLLAAEPVWLLTGGETAIVTIGAAGHLAGLPPGALAQRAWDAIRRVPGMPAAMPPHRALKFRDGTYLHSPASERAKPEPSAGLANLRIAGDWTMPGMAASLDSAAASGRRAALALLGR